MQGRVAGRGLGVQVRAVVHRFFGFGVAARDLHLAQVGIERGDGLLQDVVQVRVGANRVMAGGADQAGHIHADAAGVRLTDYRELLETISQFAAGAAAELREGVDGVVSDVAGGLDDMAEVGALGDGFSGGYVDRKAVLGTLGAGHDWEGAVAKFDKGDGV